MQHVVVLDGRVGNVFATYMQKSGRIERACDLEVQNALDLYRSEKAKLQDACEVMRKARQRAG